MERAGLPGDEAARLPWREQRGRMGSASDRLGNRPMQPAGQALAAMGSEDDQVALTVVDGSQDRSHGVAIEGADLGQMNPELVSYVLARAALWQSPPPGQGSPRPRK